MGFFGRLRYPSDAYSPRDPEADTNHRTIQGLPIWNTNRPDIEPSAEDNARAFISRIEGSENWPGKFALRELMEEYEDACERRWGRVISWDIPWDDSRGKIRTLLAEVDKRDKWLVAVFSRLCRYRLQCEWLFDEARQYHALGPQTANSIPWKFVSAADSEKAEPDDQQHSEG